MKFHALTGVRYLVRVFLLSWFQVSCTAEVTESDCRRVQQEVTTFTAENILPLVDSKGPPHIERRMVERLQGLREKVRTCALPDLPDDATGWNEDDFMLLDWRLAFFEVTLEQALDEDPTIEKAMTRILVDSRSFREAVQELRLMLGIEDRQQP